LPGKARALVLFFNPVLLIDRFRSNAPVARDARAVDRDRRPWRSSPEAPDVKMLVEIPTSASRSRRREKRLRPVETRAERWNDGC